MSNSTARAPGLVLLRAGSTVGAEDQTSLLPSRQLRGHWFLFMSNQARISFVNSFVVNSHVLGLLLVLPSGFSASVRNSIAVTAMLTLFQVKTLQ